MLRLIQAQGTSYEIGQIHGTQAREQILISIKTYKDLFSYYANVDWETARSRALSFVEPIKAFDADLLEEMRGVAAGAGVEFEDILILNVRSEILFMKGNAPAEGCTAIGIVPELTKENRLLHAQTWDWIPAQEPAMIVLRITQMNKPKILMLTEAGIIGKIGLNSEGIGITLNAMSVPREAKGVPLHIVLRGMLNSYNMVRAMETIIKHKCASAANIMVSSRDGEVLDLEIAGPDYDVLYPDDGICVHTNHFLSERLKSVYYDKNRDSAISTHVRLGRVRRKLRSMGSQITMENIHSIMCDHAGFPEAICYHPNINVPVSERGATVASMIMDTSLGTMYASVGRPCESPYGLFRLV